MRRWLLVLALLCPAVVSAQGRVRVRAHFDRGHYVAPHVRTAPNRSRLDNWSTRGQVNPYTGRRGDRPPVAAPRVRKPRRR